MIFPVGYVASRVFCNSEWKVFAEGVSTSVSSPVSVVRHMSPSPRRCSVLMVIVNSPFDTETLRTDDVSLVIPVISGMGGAFSCVGVVVGDGSSKWFVLEN